MALMLINDDVLIDIFRLFPRQKLAEFELVCTWFARIIDECVHTVHLCRNLTVRILTAESVVITNSVSCNSFNFREKNVKKI